MSEQFTIVGEEYVGYMQGNAYIIGNGECEFSLWERKEDAQKVCDYLNEQQATISALKEENEQLRQIMNDIVVATDETYTKNASVFKVTVVLDFEKYMEIRRCIE